MKKEWILSEEEKQQKRAKIEENRAKKRTPSSSNPASNNPSANSAVNSPQESVAGDDEEGGPPSASPQPTPSQDRNSLDSPEAGEEAVIAATPALLESRPQARVLPSARAAATGSENGSIRPRPSKVKTASFNSVHSTDVLIWISCTGAAIQLSTLLCSISPCDSARIFPSLRIRVWRQSPAEPDDDDALCRLGTRRRLAVFPTDPSPAASAPHSVPRVTISFHDVLLAASGSASTATSVLPY